MMTIPTNQQPATQPVRAVTGGPGPQARQSLAGQPVSHRALGWSIDWLGPIFVH